MLETFDQFYARELKPVVGLAFVLSGSRAAAEDLAQESFIAAYRRWDRIGSYDDPGAWVRRVVANRSVSASRRRRAEVRAVLRLTPRTVTVADTPEDRWVWEAVRRLPRRQRQVIALRYVDQSSIAEIASILECSPNTVKTHLQRARRALAETIGGTGE